MRTEALCLWLCFSAAPLLNAQTPASRNAGQVNDLRIFADTRYESLLTSKPAAVTSGILDLIGSQNCLVLLKRGPEFLTLIDPRGYDVAWANVTGIRGLLGEHLNPVALTWFDWPLRDGDPGVLVLAEDGAALYLFDHRLRQLGDGPLVRVPQMRGRAVALGPRGHIFVADAGIPGIRVFHAAGGELLTYGERGAVDGDEHADSNSAGKFNEPCGILVEPQGDVLVMDRGNCTYAVCKYEPRPNRMKWTATGPWLPGVDVRFDDAGRVLLAGPVESNTAAGALRVMNFSGAAERVFTGAALGGLSARLRVCQGPDGKYYLAEPEKDRILIVPPDFVEKLPQFEWTRDGGVKLTMTKVDGSTVTTVSRERPPKDGGRILVRQSEPVCESWPPALVDELVAYSLPPAPPRGKTYVIDMPVLVAVFAKAIDENGALTTIEPTGVIERLQRELETDRLFYWRNSYGTLNKQFEFMLIDDAEPRIADGWIEPTAARTLVNEARQKRRLPPIGPDHSLVAIHPMSGFDPAFTDDVGTVDGGGLTIYAYSSYGLWNNGQAWLMAHEWGHQLDDFFQKSGFDDWWSNHPDGALHIGRYGEHWDCNAFLCRRADKMNWLRLRYGALRLVDDRDEDGLADDDPTLPLDERRFGSDSWEPDSDLDGLSDLQEMAAGAFSSTNPLKRDTNGNGTSDGHEPYPQFAVKTAIARADEQLMQRILAGEPPEPLLEKLGRISSAWCDTDVYAVYTPETLTLLFTLRKPVRRVFAPVDFNNDGWFVGSDQVYASAQLEWPAGGQPRLRGAELCEAAISSQAGGPILLLKISVPAAREPLRPGSSVALCVRVENGAGCVAFLLDPWQLLSLSLRESGALERSEQAKEVAG